MDLVTGATSVAGAHLVCSLLNKGRQVRAIRASYCNTEKTKKILSFYSSDADTLFSEIEWIEADYKEADSLYAAFDDVDTVYNCLPLVTDRKRCSVASSIDLNVDIIKNILSVAQDCNVKYFCHLSNVEALGSEPDFKEITEQSQRNPKVNYSAYSQLQFRVENEVRRASFEGLPVGIINAGVILGPGFWNNGFPGLIHEIARGLRFYADGASAFVGVNDVVKAAQAMRKSNITGENFIVSSQNISFKELSGYIAKSLKVKVPSVKAGPFLLSVLKICSHIKQMFTGESGFITSDIRNGVSSFKYYSNEKSLGRIIIDYQPIEQVVDEICKIYLNDKIK